MLTISPGNEKSANMDIQLPLLRYVRGSKEESMALEMHNHLHPKAR